MITLADIKQRYQYPTILIKRLAITNFKLRYQGSVLGYVWSLLKPLALFTILYIVFVRFLKFGGDIEHFSMYLLLGVVFWSFFVEMTNGSVRAIVDHGDLIRRINFPKYTIVVATSVSALINFGLNLIVVGLFMGMTGVGVGWEILWLGPIIGQLYLVSLGLSLFLASVYVHFRDSGHIWEVIAQGLFYLTPILYPLSLVSDEIARWLLINPLAQIIQDGRYVMITNQTPTIDHFFSQPLIRLGPVMICLIGLAMAIIYFRRQSLKFAERV